MDDRAQEPTSQASARRRLIRGSFSLPAVLAVHNGSALAQASSKFRCMVNATTLSGHSVYPAEVTDASLGAVNGRVPIYEVAGTTPKYYVKAADLAYIGNTLLGGYVAPAASTSGQNIYVRYITGGTYKFAEAFVSPTATNRRAAVLLQAFGTAPNQYVKVVGFVQPGQSSIAGVSGANASCWASVKP